MYVEWLLIGTWPFWLLTAVIVTAIIAAVEHEKGFWASVCFAGYLGALHLAGGVDLLVWARSHIEWLVGGAIGYLVIGAAWGVAKWWLFTKKQAVAVEENYRKCRAYFLRVGLLHPEDVSKALRKEGANADIFRNFLRVGEFLFPGTSKSSDHRDIRIISVPDATEDTPVPPEMRAAWQIYIKEPHLRSSSNLCSDQLTQPSLNDHKSTILTWMTFWPASLLWTLLNDPIRAAFRHIYISLSRTLQAISDHAFSRVSDLRSADTIQDSDAKTPPEWKG